MLRRTLKQALVWVVALLTGCASTSLQAPLINGVESARYSFALEVRLSDDVNRDCIAQYRVFGLAVNPVLAHNGCAFYPLDSELKKGVKPWCLIIVPRYAANSWLGHEVAHCIGHDHNGISLNG